MDPVSDLPLVRLGCILRPRAVQKIRTEIESTVNRKLYFCIQTIEATKVTNVDIKNK